jgi:hypothetical protein
VRRRDLLFQRWSYGAGAALGFGLAFGFFGFVLADNWLLLAWASRCGRACSRPFGPLRAPGPSTPDAAPGRAARGGGSYGVRGGLRLARCSVLVRRSSSSTSDCAIGLRLACARRCSELRAALSAPRPLANPTNEKIPGIRVAGDSLFCSAVSVSVGSGRLDARHHGGPLLMRDRHKNRGFRVRLPDGMRRQVTRSDTGLGNGGETGSDAAMLAE